jgi:hypothetical protein
MMMKLIMFRMIVILVMFVNTNAHENIKSTQGIVTNNFVAPTMPRYCGRLWQDGRISEWIRPKPKQRSDVEISPPAARVAPGG